MQTMRVGHLPVWLMWNNNTNGFERQVGAYVVEKPFYLDADNIKGWTVLYPWHATWRTIEELEQGLREAGNSEETIRLLCGRDQTVATWYAHFLRLRFHADSAEATSPVKRKEAT